MKRWGLTVVLCIASAAAGALLYPSKRVEERDRVIRELTAERTRLEARALDLEARTRETVTVLEKPDGTRRTRVTRRRDEVRRERTSVAAAEKTAERVDVARERVTETNRRRFGIQAGIRTDLAYFVAAEADALGPFFIGFHADTRGALGVGLGLRF